MPKQRKVSQSGIWRRRPLQTKFIMPADAACSWGRWITNCNNKGNTGHRVRGCHGLRLNTIPSRKRPLHHITIPPQTLENMGEVLLRRIRLFVSLIVLSDKPLILCDLWPLSLSPPPYSLRQLTQKEVLHMISIWVFCWWDIGDKDACSLLLTVLISQVCGIF